MPLPKNRPMPDTSLCPRPDKQHFFSKEEVYAKRRRLRGRGQVGAPKVYQCACGLWTLGRDDKRKR